MLIGRAVVSGSSVVTPDISTALLCGDALCNTSSLELSRPVKIVLEHHSLSFSRSNATTEDLERNLCSFWQLDP